MFAKRLRAYRPLGCELTEAAKAANAAIRLGGLRGVGKTVLLKEYRDAARKRDSVVILVT